MYLPAVPEASLFDMPLLLPTPVFTLLVQPWRLLWALQEGGIHSGPGSALETALSTVGRQPVMIRIAFIGLVLSGFWRGFSATALTYCSSQYICSTS